MPLLFSFFRTWSVTANQAPYLKIVELIIKLIKFFIPHGPSTAFCIGSLILYYSQINTGECGSAFIIYFSVFAFISSNWSSVH